MTPHEDKREKREHLKEETLSIFQVQPVTSVCQNLLFTKLHSKCTSYVILLI